MLPKEVIPELNVLQGIDTAASTNFQNILLRTVDILCEDLSWVGAPTMKQKFHWGLVSACCSKINISHKDWDWVYNYGKVLMPICEVFNFYCKGKELTEDNIIIIEQLPPEIETSSSEDILRYTFLKYKINL